MTAGHKRTQDSWDLNLDSIRDAGKLRVGALVTETETKVPAMRFGAFIMTFNRASILPRTIDKVLSQTVSPEAILIVDNASTDNTREVVECLNDPRISYIRLETNTGPAGAANKGIGWAVEHEFDWLYWGDDDDPPPREDTFERLLDLAKRDGGDDIGALGIVGARWDWDKGELMRFTDDQVSDTLEVDFVGGGHALIISNRALKTVDPPKAELFFGFEEPEYCLRIRQTGLRILVDGNQMMMNRERLGRLGLETRADLRAARGGSRKLWSKRQYYSTRNYIYSMRHSFNRPDLARREALKSIGRSFYSLRFGPLHALTFTWHELRAIFDAYTGRMGKTIDLR